MEEYIIKSPDIVKKCQQLIKQKVVTTQPSDTGTDTSESFRKRANVMYKSNKSKLKDVLLLYTLSARVADPDSEDLTLALGNRSAVTFELKQYELCLRDIESVLVLSPSLALLKRLLLRKARCLLYLYNMNACKQVCDEITEMCEQGKITLNKSEGDCMEEVRVALSLASATSGTPQEKATPSTQGVLRSPHKALPAASDVIELKQSESKGRYLQVTSGVASGCTLIREQPYTFVLLPDYWSSHCYHCLVPLHSIPTFNYVTKTPLGQGHFPPVFEEEKRKGKDWFENFRKRNGLAMRKPEATSLARQTAFNRHIVSEFYSKLEEVYTSCRSKSCMARFCSVPCQRRASESYHKYECKCLDIVVNTGIGHLAYRIITYTGYQTLMDHRKVLLMNGAEFGDRSSDLKAYDEVYNLVTNSEHILAEDLHQYKETALLLLMCLMESQFFPFSTPSLTDPYVIYVGTLLLRHIEQLICNAHAITVMSSSDSESGSEERVYSHTQDKMATAIYPTASLMNHSCKPNIIASFLGSELIVKTSVNLGAGEEIFNCYGPHYQKMERADRQQSLAAQYYFTCECEPCQHEKGQVSSLKCLCCLECQGRSLLISDSEAKCQECDAVYYAGGQINNLVTAQQILEDAKTAKPQQGLEMVRKAKGILLNQVVHKYSMDMANAFDQEAQCLASLGDMRSCGDALLSSIAIIEQLYPEHSAERAHEYRKLSEVLCTTHQYPRALDYAKKARSIFARQYSDSHELVNEIDELCSQIQMASTSS